MSPQQNVVSTLATAIWRRRHPDISLEHPDREIPHLTLGFRSLPRYALDRAQHVLAKRRHGYDGLPFITDESREILETMLRPTDQGIEFGSGGSTEWLARHVEQVYAVEGFAHWHGPLAERLARRGLTNVDLVLVDADELGYESPAHHDAYVNAHGHLGPESIDFVFDDGEYRDDAALRGIKLLKPGGVFILDNSNAYLPTSSRSPWKVDHPATPKWTQFLDEVAGWRHIWTTNGVWDTALWVKP